MMGPLGRSLLVLCVAMSITTLCAQQGERVSDREAVALLLDAYNRESHDDYIFGLLETKPASDQAGRRILSFTVQETKCLKSENQNLDQCEFKEGGVVKDCKGEVSSERHLPVVVVSCDSVDAQVLSQLTPGLCLLSSVTLILAPISMDLILELISPEPRLVPISLDLTKLPIWIPISCPQFHPGPRTTKPASLMNSKI
ncbi:cathelicidin-6-like isoform X1 [Dromiciops gliroides]|uniref:cathelicidin-6-like isoform X1 n=1 Tax=Dromiciops gliroides TaxID=33562 RepID=UPI001CC3BC1B|nr:cathelicidin-6-like isoform X1 [Dromiciops gliroides]